MAESDNITVNVHVDSTDIESKLEEISKGLNNITNEVHEAVNNCTVKQLDALEIISSQLNETEELMSGVTSELIGAIAEVIASIQEAVASISENIVQKMEDLYAKQAEDDKDTFVADKGFDTALALFMEALKGQVNGNGNNSFPQGGIPGQLALPAPQNSKTTGGSETSGLVSGLLADAGNLFPSTESMDSMATSLGNVATKLKESTLEWVTNTGAKTASTAAEWAHIAATTAWEAICSAATVVTTALGAAMNFLTSPIGLVLLAVTALIAIVVLLVKNWDTVKEVAAKVWQGIVDVWNTVSAWFNENVIQPVVGFFSNMWDGICGFASAAWDGIVAVFQGVAAWFDKYVVQPVNEIVSKIADGFKNMVNGVIGFINGMIAGIIRGINGVIEALNKLKFTVPDWVPGLGGQTLGFNLKTLTAPQIPYLAKGAVLPANKPFMAVVGDQRHGTNIEAPLTTIQEAVAGVMDNHIAAMMAGFNALLQEQIALRHTVESIELGDNTIAEAVERYHEKMSIVYGYGAG